MKDTTVTLTRLRELLKKPPGYDLSLSAYIIPSDDAHQSEYISAHDERRAFISGFDGSAGTALVTTDNALLWTDGRYYQQAQKQLDKNWTLMKDGLPDTPTIGNWLIKNLPPGSRIGFDPRLISHRVWKPTHKSLTGHDCEFVPIDTDLVDLVWDNQPRAPVKPVITLPTSITGKTIKDKVTEIRKEMAEKETEALVVSALDEVAWLMNARGSDIDYNPVFLAYLIITKNEIYLFIDQEKLPSNFNDHLEANEVKVNIAGYNEISTVLKKIVLEGKERIWIAPTSSYYLTSMVPKRKIHLEITPIAVMKALKNAIEAEGMVNSHIRDGVALCKYFAWLEKALNDGEEVDEISGATKLEMFRSQQEHYMGLSFTTISASGPNGSVIHYHPMPETNRKITRNEVYLCDSGGQYKDGTTDVTRTIHFGEPTEFQKISYTRVLMGQLTLGATIFPKKVKGQVLDTLARKALWDYGLDYGHGTGHGIGHFLNVHEGPMGIGIRPYPDDPGLQENMFISNEPGYYQVGEFGIRIEDIVQVVPAETASHDFSGRGALTFKTITMCPKQTKMVKKELMSAEQVKLLNDYNELVWETLSPILKKENDTLTLQWLERECKAI
ncbi:xaa-Pro aminopeptidase ApepP isoform X2 [Hermetia illucens]|nr:xaa-Pro aminopeptidase ApepP isoform X2 [Hermetia illucens]